MKTICEEHDEAGACTKECADLINSMSYSEGIPYDPTGCSYPPPMPEEYFALDEVNRAVVRVTYHPDGCQCETCAAKAEADPTWQGDEWTEGEPEPAPRVCAHCDQEIGQTEDGIWLHVDETFDHLVRPVIANDTQEV